VIHGAQHTIIVIGVLQEILGRDAVTGGAGVTRELKVFFQHLIGVAANAQLLPTAFKTLNLVLAATHPVRLARAAATCASVVVVLFHKSVISSSTVIEIGSSSRMSASVRNLQISRSSCCRSSRRWTQSMCGGAVIGLASLSDGRLFPRTRPMVSPDCR